MTYDQYIEILTASNQWYDDLYKYNCEKLALDLPDKTSTFESYVEVIIDFLKDRYKDNTYITSKLNEVDCTELALRIKKENPDFPEKYYDMSFQDKAWYLYDVYVSLQQPFFYSIMFDPKNRVCNTKMTIDTPMDIIITDPCYIGGSDDLPEITDRHNGIGYFGKDEPLSQYIFGNTIYGDWSCTVYRIEQDAEQLDNFLDFVTEYEYGKDTDELADEQYDQECNKRFKELQPSKIGRFCADAGLVGVFILDEVKKYNPNFEKEYLHKDWVVTKISDFVGTIEYKVYEDTVYIVGKGNYNFFSTQTGF